MMTSDQVKERHIEKLGSDLGEIYHKLWNELCWLNVKWEEYVVLFGTKPTRVDLLNKAASSFFRVVEDSIWSDCILHVARLTDSPKSAGKKNLTFRQLPDLIEDDACKKDVVNLIDIALDKASFCRDWRNRKLAHKDLGLALNSGAKPLEPATRLKVKDALKSLADILNSISFHYMNSTTDYTHIASPATGAGNLLYLINDGIKYNKERRERFDKGIFLDKDMEKESL